MGNLKIKWKVLLLQCYLELCPPLTSVLIRPFGTSLLKQCKSAAINGKTDGRVMTILGKLTRNPSSGNLSIPIMAFMLIWIWCKIRLLLVLGKTDKSTKCMSMNIRDLKKFTQRRMCSWWARRESLPQQVSCKASSEIAGSLPVPLPSLRFQRACMRSCTWTLASSTIQLVFSDTSSGLERIGFPSTSTTSFQFAIHTATPRIIWNLMELTNPNSVHGGCHYLRRPSPSWMATTIEPWAAQDTRVWECSPVNPSSWFNTKRSCHWVQSSSFSTEWLWKTTRWSSHAAQFQKV